MNNIGNLNDYKSLFYITPSMKVVEVSTHSVLCQSNLSDDDNNTGSGHGMPWDD